MNDRHCLNEFISSFFQEHRKRVHVNVLALLLCLLFATSAVANDKPPDWTVGAVWYKILPERFRNTVTSNDPVKEDVIGTDSHDWQIHPWASDWYKRQVWEHARNESFAEVVRYRRYGGDLYGVYEKLRYLKNLGVSVIYLMPLFESPSVLKYDATTFHHVDNNFGLDRKGDVEKIETEKEDPDTWTLTNGDEVFFEMVEQAHELDLRIVLDAEFHFCNEQFWAFKDVRENQQESAYKDWFEVTKWDDPLTPDTLEFEYATWQNNPHWPLFRKEAGNLAPPVKDYIFAATRRWMDPDGDGDPSDGIDGWVVRHYDQWGEQMLRDWLAHVKSINADAVTVAETRTAGARADAPSGFDLNTNQAFTQAVYDFFVPEQGAVSVTDFHQRLAAMQVQNVGSDVNAQLNPVDDLAKCRVASVIRNRRAAHADSVSNGGDSANGRYDPRKPADEDYRIQNLITMFQLTYPGAPLILYGDESGMWGCGHPDMLKPMIWKEFIYEDETYSAVYPAFTERVKTGFNPEVFKVYQQLNKIREDNPALRRGSFEALITDDDRMIYVYRRKLGKHEVVVFLNNGSSKQTVAFQPDWTAGTKVKNPVTRKKYQFKGEPLQIEIDGKSGVILVKSK